MKNILILLLSVVLIIGCSRVKSKDYYLKHIDEARNVYEKCGYPSNTENAQNCINAGEASRQEAGLPF